MGKSRLVVWYEICLRKEKELLKAFKINHSCQRLFCQSINSVRSCVDEACGGIYNIDLTHSKHEAGIQ